MEIHTIEFERKIRSSRRYQPGTCPHYILLLSKSPMVFGFGGRREERPSGQAVFYRPSDTVDFEGIGEFMAYDLVAFNMSKQEASVVEALPLPREEPVAPPNFSEASTCMKTIYHLFYSPDRYRMEKMDINLRNLIYVLASGDDPDEAVKEKGALRHKMEQFRLLISDDPSRYKNARQAAASVEISVSRFEHLYQEYFHMTFVQDLIRTRMKRACMLLRTTDWTVSRISAEIGYESEAHFYHLFKREMGQTPSEYRSINTIGF